ncbi:MAG: hypothetical protein IPH24_12310 [Crocinitomicaceae bacterium]|nr:hypothetical protein [Crocinitomicaceae bacterium]
MNIKPIKTKKDYQNALNRLEVIFDAPANSKLGDEAEISEILNRKKKLTVEMIRTLEKHLQLSASILVGNYKLQE